MKSYHKLKEETKEQEQLIDRIRYEQRQESIKNAARMDNLENTVYKLKDFIIRTVAEADDQKEAAARVFHYLGDEFDHIIVPTKK
jgi:hypothetical protein